MADVFKANNVAVITGAAKGIGRALARRCASEGMRVVLADKDQAPHIKVSVLCPGIVKTQIMSSAHRPQAMSVDPPAAQRQSNAEEQRLQGALQEGMAPETVAELVFEAVREERFYILTHPERNWQIRDRMEDILLGRNPTGTTTPRSPHNTR
jgi:NAD(P)-dependent dehydrogenase (short-subunit alcohol dehydrogenase family)